MRTGELETLLTKPQCYPDLSGQVVLITGAGSGIGRATALRLAAEGMKVAGCGRRADKLEETVALITSSGGEAMGVPADVTDADALTHFVQRAVERFGRVDALVHNAMAMRCSPFEELTVGQWEDAFSTGPRAAYLLASLVLPGMVERGRGSIIFVSSVLATRVNRRSLAYSAAKGALESMTRQMAIEFAGRGIRVNAAAPGLIFTWGQITEKRLAHELVPVQRAGTPAEMAAVTAFLLSHQSSYITGQIIHADGGTGIQLTPPGLHL